MNVRLVALSDFVGRKVLRADGSHLGRITDVEVRVELRGHRAAYVVDFWHLSHFGKLNWLARSRVMQQMVELLGSAVGYSRLRIPVSQLDVRNEDVPRLRY